MHSVLKIYSHSYRFFFFFFVFGLESKVRTAFPHIWFDPPIGSGRVWGGDPELTLLALPPTENHFESEACRLTQELLVQFRLRWPHILIRCWRR